MIVERIRAPPAGSPAAAFCVRRHKPMIIGAREIPWPRYGLLFVVHDRIVSPS